MGDQFYGLDRLDNMHLKPGTGRAHAVFRTGLRRQGQRGVLPPLSFPKPRIRRPAFSSNSVPRTLADNTDLDDCKKPTGRELTRQIPTPHLAVSR